MTADVYAVGILADLQGAWRLLWRGEPARALERLRLRLWYLRRQVKRRNWRAVRNTFNGYLAEHDNHPHNCGRGWTKRAAVRRVDRLCAAVPRPVSYERDDGTLAVWDGETWTYEGGPR